MVNLQQSPKPGEVFHTYTILYDYYLGRHRCHASGRGKIAAPTLSLQVAKQRILAHYSTDKMHQNKEHEKILLLMVFWRVINLVTKTLMTLQYAVYLLTCCTTK